MNFYSPEYLADCFVYQPDTGALNWRARPLEHFNSVQGWRCFNSRDAGRSAGGLQPNGYLALRLDRQMLYVHRIAWAIGHKQAIPTEMTVDHINGIKIDNRLANLRLATRAENGRNRVGKRAFPKNVHFDASRNKYLVNFTVNFKTINFGRFDTLEEAAAVARAKRAELHGEFANHGDGA